MAGHKTGKEIIERLRSTIRKAEDDVAHLDFGPPDERENTPSPSLAARYTLKTMLAGVSALGFLIQRLPAKEPARPGARRAKAEGDDAAP
jgi:hypothetical protein